jgi:hypothetical protein
MRYGDLLTSGRLLAMAPASVLQFGSKRLSAKVLQVKLPVFPRPVGHHNLEGPYDQPGNAALYRLRSRSCKTADPSRIASLVLEISMHN